MKLPKWLTRNYPIWLGAFVVLMALGDVFTTGHFLKMGIQEGNAITLFLWSIIGFWPTAMIRVGQPILYMFIARWLMNWSYLHYSKQGYSKPKLLEFGYAMEILFLSLLGFSGLLVVCLNANAITQLPLSPILYQFATAYMSIVP